MNSSYRRRKVSDQPSLYFGDLFDFHSTLNVLVKKKISILFTRSLYDYVDDILMKYREECHIDTVKG